MKPITVIKLLEPVGVLVCMVGGCLWESSVLIKLNWVWLGRSGGLIYFEH